jgi:hypothetical protein
MSEDTSSQSRRTSHLQIGDTLPLHKYSDQNIPLETLTLWFYHAHCREDADEIEQLEMAIEEIIQSNATRKP